VEKTGEHRIFARKAKSPVSDEAALDPATAALPRRRKQSFDQDRIEGFLANPGALAAEDLAPVGAATPGSRSAGGKTGRRRGAIALFLCVLAGVENWS
jgi:hypothetical protein